MLKHIENQDDYIEYKERVNKFFKERVLTIYHNRILNQNLTFRITIVIAVAVI